MLYMTLTSLIIGLFLIILMDNQRPALVPINIKQRDLDR
jgi:hypothetical protein